MLLCRTGSHEPKLWYHSRSCQEPNTCCGNNNCWTPETHTLHLRAWEAEPVFLRPPWRLPTPALNEQVIIRPLQRLDNQLVIWIRRVGGGISGGVAEGQEALIYIGFKGPVGTCGRGHREVYNWYCAALNKVKYSKITVTQQIFKHPKIVTWGQKN